MGAQATTVTAAITSAVLYNMQSPEANIVELFGSFQGNGTGSPTVFRGGWFSAVTHVSTGLYRVRCNLNIPTLVVAGTPGGLIGEPFAYIVSETITTMPAVSTGFAWLPQCSCYDVTTNINTFDITTGLMTDATPPVVWTATDVQTTDRVFFRLAFKNSSVTP